MDRSDQLRAEHVGKVGRDCGKPAAVHRKNYAERGDEQRDVSCGATSAPNESAERALPVAMG